MNEIVNRFLLTGETFMPEIHLRRPGLTYSVCGPFTLEKERTQKSKETGICDIFIKTNYVNIVFDITLLMGISKI